MSRTFIRVLKFIKGTDLKKIQSHIKSSRGSFKSYDVWLEVDELEHLDKRPKIGNDFWNYHKTWSSRSCYYHVKVFYRKKVLE